MISLYPKDCSEALFNEFGKVLIDRQIFHAVTCEDDSMVLKIAEKDYDEVLRLAALSNIHFDYSYNYAINRKGYSIRISW